MFSTVLVSQYMDKLYDGTIPSLEFVPVDVETVSLIISSLHVQKRSRADGLQTQFVIEPLLIWQGLLLF